MSEASESARPGALRCERCGKYGALETGAGTLCSECHQLSGSCCPEFGGDDLTQAVLEDGAKTAASGDARPEVE